jgi:hypothetical protein
MTRFVLIAACLAACDATPRAPALDGKSDSATVYRCTSSSDGVSTNKIDVTLNGDEVAFDLYDADGNASSYTGAPIDKLPDDPAYARYRLPEHAGDFAIDSLGLSFAMFQPAQSGTLYGDPVSDRWKCRLSRP